MAEFIKLSIGQDAVFTVREVSESTSGKWPDYVFHSEEGPAYTAPKAGMDRQFKKLGVTLGGIVGCVVKIERAPNAEDATKSWWNFYLESPAALKSATAAPSKRLTHADASGPAIRGLDDDGPPIWEEGIDPDESDPFAYQPSHAPAAPAPRIASPIATTAPATRTVASDVSLDDTAQRYLALYDHVFVHIARICKQQSVPMDVMSVNAATFSIWGSCK